MRSTRNTVGGVFAAITAGISLVMAIWDVVSWIMTMSLGNFFAGRPFLSFFVCRNYVVFHDWCMCKFSCCNCTFKTWE